MSWCNIKNMKQWCEEEIIDYYDCNPNLILSDYAKQLGMSVQYLKNVLMS